MSGTTNIGSIVGGDIYLCADARLTNSDTHHIVNKHYNKVTRVDGLNIYLSMCGWKKLSKEMQANVLRKLADEEFPSVLVVATWANKYFRERALHVLEIVGEEPDDKKGASWMKWKNDYLIWEARYKNTLSMICGFDENEVPKVFVANHRYDVPLDISKDYSLNQIKHGISAEDDLYRKHKKSPNHCVRGSCNGPVTKFIEKSSIFIGINNLFKDTKDLEEQRRLGDTLVFDDLAKEYCRALFCASMNDIHTGGDIIVKKISRRGVCQTFERNIVRYYLDCFEELEDDHVILLLVKERSFHEATRAKLNNYFVKEFTYFNTTSVDPIGWLREYGIYRMPITPMDDISKGDLLEVTYGQLLEKSTEAGPFETVTLTVSDLPLHVAKPSKEMLNALVMHY